MQWQNLIGILVYAKKAQQKHHLEAPPSRIIFCSAERHTKGSTEGPSWCMLSFFQDEGEKPQLGAEAMYVFHLLYRY